MPCAIWSSTLGIEFVDTMPHDAMAEQSVLGAMMLDPECIPDVVSAISADDFYYDSNRALYSAIIGMFDSGAGIDPVTVASAAKEVQNAEEIVKGCIVQVPTTRNIGEYVKQVKDSAVLRSVITLATDILERAKEREDSRSLLDDAERTIYQLQQGRTGGLVKAEKSLAAIYRSISDLARGEKKLPGLTTGIRELDDAIMGLNKGDLILLASRPGMGKTSLAMNIALHVAKQGIPVAVFSLEMPTEQLVRRMLSGEAYIDQTKLRTGSMDRGEWAKLSAAISSVGKAELYIDDNSMSTVSDMNAQCRKIKNLGLVVIDYIQLMSSAAGSTAENRQQTISEISRMLKVMAKELGVPVLCLSQLSRESAKRADKRPTLSDLRESGSLEQDADVVLGIYREGYFDNEAEVESAELIVMKNRNGMTCSIPLQWLPQYTTYTSAARGMTNEG